MIYGDKNGYLREKKNQAKIPNSKPLNPPSNGLKDHKNNCAQNVSFSFVT